MSNIIEVLMKDGICDSNFRAAHIANGLKLHELKTDKASLYRDWRNSKIYGKQTAPCFEKAIAGEPVPQMTLIDGVMHSEES